MMPSSRARSRAACIEARAALGFLVAVEAGPAGELLLLRNTIARQVKANIGRLPSALAEAGEI